MMAIFEKDIGTFLMEESHQVVIIPLEVSPKREFRLHIDTLDVCSHKGSFWRTPGMETEMVDAIAFAYLQITAPRCQIHRNMACVGEYTCIVFATKKSLMAVDSELSAAKKRNELSLIEVKCQVGARSDLGRPTTSALENKLAFMEHLKDCK